jgi:beta-N-acetylhexosaminidase
MRDELDRAAAGCLFPGFEGIAAPDWISRWLDRGLGGVVLFARNIESPKQVAALTRALRDGRADVLVATDEEGGDVTRLEARTGSSFPGNWALGVVDDPELTEEIADEIAGELAAVGINFDLAPVADVNSNPDNPVIGVRSFGPEPARVARHVSAYVAGIQGRGVAACAKHFPGHGDTSQDSHLALPVVEGDVSGALVPFRAAVAAGVRSIMTAHVRVPALGDEPATLSRRILHDLLRDELGFGGVAITDALEMHAVSATVGVKEAAVRALGAGADALCLGAKVDEALVAAVHGAVLEAVRTGRLGEERLREAAGRVAGLAAWAAQPRPGRAGPDSGLGVARRALAVDGTVRLSRPPLVVELRPAASIAAGDAQHTLAELLGSSRTIRVERAPADAAAMLAGHDGAQPVIVVRDAHRHAWERETVERLVAADPESVVVELGLPLWRPDGPAGYIATYGGGRANLAAAAERLSTRFRRTCGNRLCKPG